ncbi:hypothetical protein GLOTRDRAFT_95643 [Gloeophyllum trabeum ATCC 11539]|uniref:Uncharacterized protein n=1 Tax=Gloeophyllum trabeum (strain ATCC 11539 / FP-39264 / Madison 617) TaxID=670483 RepID=S7PYU4_GLOTA|nr:uncharacterized protein GLOTRDRAFT_95643 [Gloeophyllum trabeum ATCC 11539]EPQ52816.1 hypothetical protein GLOTRDRAFT_95643 [Gloeophyllum trabeum ATCC 11539]
MRRLEPTYPSFNLVVNEALDDPLRLPPYHSFHRRPHSHPAYGPARFEDPLMTTVNYGLQSTDDLSAVPELSFSDFWPPDEEAANLQAALENRRIAKGSISRRRSFSDLVIVSVRMGVRFGSHNQTEVSKEPL